MSGTEERSDELTEITVSEELNISMEATRMGLDDYREHPPLAPYAWR